MLLQKGKSKSVIDENIHRIVKEEKPSKQAIAIALSIARGARKK